MDGTSKTERPGDRRGTDRRRAKQPFPGADKRAAERRAGHDRRSDPRR
jgi:hypothetical protein